MSVSNRSFLLSDFLSYIYFYPAHAMGLKGKWLLKAGV